jgi:F-type H+-transporting ATPase subunit b
MSRSAGGAAQRAAPGVGEAGRKGSSIMTAFGTPFGKAARITATAAGFCLLGASAALAAEEGGASLPQLDTSTFSSQIFWLAVTFSVLFILMWKVALPRVSDVVESREQKIRADLERAEQLRDEIGKTEEEIEKVLSEARAEAQDVLRKAQDKVAEEHAKKQQKIEAELEQKTADAEERIAKARSEALSSMKEVAEEVAMAAVEKLTGDKPDAKAVSDAVQAASKEG